MQSRLRSIPAPNSEVNEMVRVATLSTPYALSMGLLIAAYAVLPALR